MNCRFSRSFLFFRSYIFIDVYFLVHAVDIWNVIEAFRENGLNTLEPQCEVSVARLETLLSSLYHSLNKRLPPAHQVRAAHCCALLLNWLLAAYCPPGYLFIIHVAFHFVESVLYIKICYFYRENVGKIRVFSIKVALATMCAGKLVDKLRCMYFIQSYDILSFIKKKFNQIIFF